mgnify:CR=1 FL=1
MGEGTTVYDGLVKKFEYLKEEHLFFAAAFRSDDQNSLKEHDFELILEFYSNLIFQKTGRRPDADHNYPPCSPPRSPAACNDARSAPPPCPDP